MDFRMVFDGSRRPVLIAVCLGLFIVQVDTTALTLALPQIQRSLHLEIASLQWIVDLYNMTYASLLLTGGLLGDRLGRKRVFATGLALFVVGSAACSLARSLPMLLGGRLLQGLGAAVEIPGTVAMLRATFPERAEQSRALAIWASVSGLALAFGPTLGGWLVAHAGWQSIFVLNLPIGGAALWLTVARVPESPRSASRRIDLPGQLLAVLLLAAMTFVIIESPRGGVGARWPLWLAAPVAAASLALFLLRERSAREPMIPLALFRSPAISAASAAAAAMTFSIYGLMFLLGLYLETVAGLSSFGAGLVILPSALFFVLTSPIAGRLSARFGPRPFMALGLLFIAGGLFLLAGLATPTELPRVGIALALTGIGMGLNTGPAVALAVGSVEAERAGIAGGIINLARMVGATMGVAVSGAVVAARAHRLHESLAAALPAGMHRSILIAAGVALAGAAVATTVAGARRPTALSGRAPKAS